MRGWLVLICCSAMLGCESKSEPTTAPSGWSPPPAVSPPTGSAVDPAKK